MKKLFGFGPEARIRKSTEFQKCQLRGAKIHSPRFILITFPNETGRARLGVVVTRRTGSAVTRNRWKRTARELFRVRQHELRSGFDHVLIIKGSNQGPPPLEAREEMETLIGKASK